MEEIKLKAEFAKLIGAQPDEIAIASSVSDLVLSIANSDYTGKRKKAGSRLIWSSLTVDYIWLANQRHGAKVDFVSVNENHEIDISEYERYIDEDTLLTSVTQVYYLNGSSRMLKRSQILPTAKARSYWSTVPVPGNRAAGRESHEHRHSRIRLPEISVRNPGRGIYVREQADHTGTEAFRPMVRPDESIPVPDQISDRAKTSRFDTGTPPVLNAYAVRQV
ncbi:MAG: aminotransferase class V-fold PLP-dependent enzyme [[Clostridium] scindens]